MNPNGLILLIVVGAFLLGLLLGYLIAPPRANPTPEPLSPLRPRQRSPLDAPTQMRRPPR